MIQIAYLGFVLLSSFAIWNSTEQRPGTSDELRALAAVIAALVIGAGLSVLGALPAGAHTLEEIEAFEQEWTQDLEDLADQAALTGGLSINGLEELVDQRADFESRHTWHYSPEDASDQRSRSSQPSTSRTSSDASRVEQWRPLVSAHFRAADIETALCLIWHESRGDPSAKNPNSSAAGLFQILDFWWQKYGGDRYDPETNIALAAKIRDIQGWTAWSPYNRGLCR